MTTPPESHHPIEVAQATLALAHRALWLEERVQTLERANLELQERLRVAQELVELVPREGAAAFTLEP
jgi:hypothetical protein